jgi:hypothetical protein
MQHSLAKTFNETAAAAYGAFPERLKNLVLLLLPDAETPVYVSPDIADQLTKNISEVKEVVKYYSDYLKDLGGAGVAQRDFDFAGIKVNVIGLVDEAHTTKGIFTRRFTKQMRILYNLDHEIGHHILKNGYSPQNAWNGAESVSDAYATLRHIQRFGMNTGRIGGYGESRAFLIVLCPEMGHYTTNTVQEAYKTAQKTDISKLSLPETAALAEKIAEATVADGLTLEKIVRAYEPAQRAVTKEIGNIPAILEKLYAKDKEAYALFCREVVAVMKKNVDDPDIFKAGKQFLSYPPIKQFMQQKAKTDLYWKGILNFIANPGTKSPKKLMV